MKFKKNHIKYTYSIMLFMLMISLFSCKCEEVDDTPAKLMKSWQLVSQTSGGIETALTPCEKENLFYFTSQNVCYSYSGCEDKTLRTAWNYDSSSKILNMADVLPVTYYIAEITANNLILKYYKYSPQGVLDEYIEHYNAVETVLTHGKLQLK